MLYVIVTSAVLGKFPVTQTICMWEYDPHNMTNTKQTADIYEYVEILMACSTQLNIL